MAAMWSVLAVCGEKRDTTGTPLCSHQPEEAALPSSKEKQKQANLLGSHSVSVGSSIFRHWNLQNQK